MYGVGDSEAIARDMNRFLFSSTLKNSSDAEFIKSRELTTTNLYETQQQQQQQQQQSCVLMRNRSAPSSFFAGLLDGNGAEDYLNPQSSMADTETIFGGFVSSDTDSRDLLQHPSNMKHENIESVQGQKGHFHSSVPARDLPSMESSFSVVENMNKVKATSGSGNCSNLIRQSSSPAGFLSNLTAENARGVGNFRANNKFGLEANSSTINLSNHMNFSSGPSSSSRFMPQIAENGHESIGRGNTVNGHLGDVNDTSRCYLPTIPNDSWNESTFTGLKRNRDGDLKMFSNLNELDSQNGDSSHYAPGLVHHLSLPKTSVEMAAVEKYLQFEQDAVPCKIRAKRGFATHPRSIAERVRRTRISQRMRKLQELFPDMDKQANTADMLDLAVEFIKDLQKEVQILKETRAKCTCSTKQKPSPTA